MAESNRALAGRILLLSAAFLAVLAVVTWAGVLPVDPAARGLFAAGFAACAVADAIIALFLMTRS